MKNTINALMALDDNQKVEDFANDYAFFGDKEM